MPVAAPEVLAYGEPFIATSVGVPCFVTQDIDAFLGPVGDAAWLYEVLRQAYAESDSFGSMDLRGYGKLGTPCAAKRVVQQADSLHAECLSEANIAMRSLDC